MRYVLVLASIAGNSFVTHHGCYVPQFLCTVLYIGSIMCHFLWYMTTHKMVKQYTLCTFSSDSSTVILKWLWTVLQSHLGKLCTHIHSGRYAHNGGSLLQCKAVSVKTPHWPAYPSVRKSVYQLWHRRKHKWADCSIFMQQPQLRDKCNGFPFCKSGLHSHCHP